MTRKDFQLIANVLSNTRTDNDVTSKLVHAMALDFAHALKATNPRFDVCRFVTACTKGNS